MQGVLCKSQELKWLPVLGKLLMIFYMTLGIVVAHCIQLYSALGLKG